MMNKGFVKAVFLLVFLALCVFNAAAQNVQVTIQFTNVVIGGGRIIGGIFFNADEFRKEEPRISFVIESTGATVSYVASLPPGEYVISAIQDSIENGQLDTGFLGIPRELVAISNYSGRGFPSRNFNSQKIPVNSSTPVITLGLYKF